MKNRDSIKILTVEESKKEESTKNSVSYIVRKKFATYQKIVRSERESKNRESRRIGTHEETVNSKNCDVGKRKTPETLKIAEPYENKDMRQN